MTETDNRVGVVYWIHLPEHTNIFEDGYVGITTQTWEKRYRQHVTSSTYLHKYNKCHILASAIIKYGDKLICEPVVTAKMDYCADLEKKLRPKERIGWNIKIGGQRPAEYTEEYREKVSLAGKKAKSCPEWKKRFSETCKARGISEATRQGSRGRLKHCKFWEFPNSDANLWLQADVIYATYLLDSSIGTRKLSSSTGIAYSKLSSILSKFRQGWIPTNDPDWLTFKNNNKEKEEKI